MANQVVEFGIRIAVDGQQSVPVIESIDGAAKKMAASVEQAGRAMAEGFTAGTDAVAKQGEAVAKKAETEEAATARIKAMVAASREQTSAVDAEARAAELSAVSTRRQADEHVNLAGALARSSAQMSAQMAARTGGAGSGSVASEESQKFVASLQRQHDMLGKNAAELAQYEAKMLGGTAATQKQAAAIASNTEALRNMIAAEERQGAAADNFIARLKDQAATVGMSRTALLTHQAAQLGVSQEAAPLIARFTEASEAAKKHADEVSKATKGHHEFSFSTAQSKKELIVLAHELSQSRFSNFGGSLMVLAEQTGAASFLFSGLGLAILATVAAMAGLAYAWIKGALEQREMNNALILTGNYAGETADSLNALAHSAVEAHGSIGKAKHAVTELASSGKFTGEQIGYITQAVVALEYGAGISIEKTIKLFESLAVQSTGSSARATEVISRAAVKLDDTYHFLTEAIYEEIRALEKDGEAKESSAVATEAFAKVVHDRAEEMIKNLGYVARAWHGVTEAIGGAVDEIGNWGKVATPGSEVKRLKAEINMIDSGGYSGPASRGRPTYSDEKLVEMRAAAVKDLAKAEADLLVVDAKAKADGAERVKQSEAVHAASRITADNVRLEKRGLNELQVALRGYYEDIEKIKKVNPASVLVTPEAIAEHVKALTAAHSTKPKAARADVVDNIGLNDQLARIQDGVAEEKAMVAQLSRIDDLFHAAGKLGDEKYYQNKIDYAKAAAKEEINGYTDQIAALRAHHNVTKEEAARHAKQIADIEAKRRVAQQKVDDETNLLGMAQFLRQEAIESASDDAMNKYISGLTAEAEKIEAANVGHEESRGAIEREMVARLDLAIAGQKQFIVEQGIAGATLAELEQAPKILKYLEDQRAARSRIADGLDRQDVDKGMKKAAERAIQEWKYVGTSIAESLSSAFGTGGKAVGGMFKSYADNAARQIQISKDLAEATKGRSDADPEKLRLTAAAQRESARAQVKSYGDITSAAKGYFKEGTAGYKVLQTTERAFRTVEMAMAVQSMVQSLAATSAKTTAVVAGKGFESAAMIGAAGVDTATTGVSIANSAAKTTASTIAGVAKAFEQLGVWGWVGAAAIIAFMVGMGASMSGGGGPAATTFEGRQKTQGSGTVLGDSTEKSKSMANSLSIMEKNSSLELGYQNSMLTALRNIESALGGAAKGLFQTAGLTAGSAFGTVNSSTKSFFGSDKSTTITDTGVKFNGSLGALRSGAASGIQYEDVTKTSDGGWFHGNSTKNSTNTRALSAAAMKPFTLIFDNMGALLVDAGVKLGADGKALNDAINTVVIDFAVSTRDLKGQDLVDALSAGVSVAFDTITQSVYPQIAEFQKVGEGLGETLVRVASNYTSLDAIMRSIGATFGAVGMSSLAAREYLIDLVGGLDKLQSQTEAFANDFLSEAERLAPVTKMVTQQMAALGLAGVTTRDQYKDVVLDLAASGKLATEAGAKQYAALLALAPEFAKVYPAAEDAVEAAKKITDAWQSVTDSIVDEIRRIRGLLGTDSTQSYAAAQASFAIATAKARAGDQEAAASLPDLSQTMLSLAESQARTALELAVIRGQTAASLEATAATAVKYGVKVPGFASGGDFGGGLRLVGENGPELEVTGPSRIYNAAQTSDMLSGSDNAALVAEMRAMREALTRFSEQSQDGDIAIAQNTGALFRIVKRLVDEGLLVRADVDQPLPVQAVPA